MTEQKNERCPICGERSVIRRPEKLRDSDAIGVLGCTRCGHAFLDSFAHITDAYFDRGRFLANKPFAETIDDRIRHYAEETEERARRIGPCIANKRVLDFGCGAGALMERIAPLCKRVVGVEPTEPFRAHIAACGFEVHRDVSTVDGPFDVVLAFHVLEHLPDPIDGLRRLAALTAPGGLVYVEVPNLNDALLALYRCAAASRFLFFQDHLQYFTRHSLGLCIAKAGLPAHVISGHNRFGLANHLYWLSRGEPQGHTIWRFLETPELASEYKRALAAADLSDSLVAEITVPHS